MREILGEAKTVRELLKGVKYSIDYYRGLPFHPHEQFMSEDLDERHELCRMIAQRVWDPRDLLAEVVR